MLSPKSVSPASLTVTRGQVTEFQIIRPSGTPLEISATVFVALLVKRGHPVLCCFLLPSDWNQRGGRRRGGSNRRTVRQLR